MADGTEVLAVFAHGSGCAIVDVPHLFVRAGLHACPACGGPRKPPGGGGAAAAADEATRFCGRCNSHIDTGL